MKVFDDIRNTCKEVTRRAKLVRIDDQGLQKFADTLDVETLHTPSIEPAHHYDATPEVQLALVLLTDAINFGSGYFPFLTKRPGMSGYMTVASSLADRFTQSGPLTPQELTTLTRNDCAFLFGQPLESMEGPIGELMDLFVTALHDFGQLTLDKYDGSYVNMVEAAEGSAEKLVRILDQMPLYHDVHRYEDLQVPFFKRAQITAADLSMAMPDHKWGTFRDIDDLTLFADNLVPHTLRMEGVLKYDPELLDRINNGELIETGSREEVEIRACGVTAVEEIVAHLRQRGIDTSARIVDYYLWNHGQEPWIKAEPRHRGRCPYY